MATNKTLSPLQPNYHKFVDNQVLTNDQLNAVIDHLNYQDQLSRVLLSGVGIVCGCNISLMDDGIHLSAGAAVTTDGNLLNAKDTHYQGFKLFEDDNVKYSRFLAGDKSTIPLWQLETNTEPSDVFPLESFERKTNFSPEDAVAVLYLEDYLKEEEECSPVNCDTQGRAAINRLRVLLISPNYIDELVEGDTIFSNLLTVENETPVSALSRLYTPRIVLTSANTKEYGEFKKAFAVSFNELAERVNNLGSIALFKNIFEKTGVNPLDALGSFSSNFTNFQYLYDFYKDLATAYNELQALLKKNYSLCCPNTNSFPKHVLLGSLVKKESTWRHRFYPSPAHDHPESANKLKNAFSRLLLMIKDFEPETKDEIIITPSRSYDESLGRRAIPFYYNLKESDDSMRFYNAWKETDNGLIPNYYGFNYPEGDFDSLNRYSDEHKFDPLDVCLEGHDFYRIEGHIGRHDVTIVHDEIQKIQKDKGLAFDIQPVAVGKDAIGATIDYDKYRTYFEDLQVMLQAWNEEQKCMMHDASKFFGGFSTVKPGYHTRYMYDDLIMTMGKAELKKTIKAAGGDRLDKSELMVLSMATIDNELDTQGIAYKAKNSKDQKVLQLLRGDKSGPGVAKINLNSLTTNELQSVAKERVRRHERTAFNIGREYKDASEAVSGKTISPKISATYLGSASIVVGAFEDFNKEGTSGYLYKDVLSISDDKNCVNSKIVSAIDGLQMNLGADLLQANFYIPAGILATLKQTEDYALANIEDFTAENLEKYINALKQQCEKAEKANKKLNALIYNKQSAISSKPYMEQYFSILDRIQSSCCLIKKVKLLYEKILERKIELLQNFVLKNFIEKHPGAEHKAGVPRGGTFVLLYYHENKGSKSDEFLEITKYFTPKIPGLQWEPPMAEYELNEMLKLAESVNMVRLTEPSEIITKKIMGPGTYELAPAKFFETAETVKSVQLMKSPELINRDIVMPVSRIKNVQPKILKEAKFWNAANRDIEILKRPADLIAYFPRYPFFPAGEQILDGTVIGDLCLPYICCSGTPSTTFVFPEQLATLRLPVDHVCMNQREEEQADLIPMDVVPADGDVKAFIQKQELDGVIIQQENGTFFDPNQVSTNDYGKIIRFEINSQAVKPYLIILTKPVASFTWSAKINPGTQNTAATVIFENDSVPFEDLAFRWNFAGDIIQDENALKFTRPFKVVPGQINKFDVKLTAFNARCSDTISSTVSINVPPIEEPEQTTCYSAEVLQCWGLKNVQAVLRNRQIAFANMSEKEMIAALLKNLRKTRGFTEEELKSVLEGLDRRRKLLSCLDIPFKASDSWKALGKLILAYQQKNCGQQIADPEVVIDADLVDVDDLNALVKTRNVFIGDSGNKADLANALEATKRANMFSKNELEMLKNDTLKKVLDSKGISYASNDTKETLTNKLVEASDKATTGVTINPDLMEISELNTVLGSRNVTLVDKENKKDLLNALNVTGGKITLKHSEAKLLRNDTLRNVLDAKNISYTSNDNKAILAGKLLSG